MSNALPLAASLNVPPPELPRARPLKRAPLVFLGDEERNAVQALIREHGVAGAARVLDVSRNTVASAAAGGGLRRGSALLISNALATLAR